MTSVYSLYNIEANIKESIEDDMINGTEGEKYLKSVQNLKDYFLKIGERKQKQNESKE